MADDAERIMGVLLDKKNIGKNFVKRILQPKDYPKLDLGKGKVATHKMAWGENEGKYHVFPTVVHDEKSNSLTDLGDRAFEHALKTGESIEASSPEEADWLSKRYKAVWGE